MKASRRMRWRAAAHSAVYVSKRRCVKYEGFGHGFGRDVGRRAHWSAWSSDNLPPWSVMLQTPLTHSWVATAAQHLTKGITRLWPSRAPSRSLTTWTTPCPPTRPSPSPWTAPATRSPERVARHHHARRSAHLGHPRPPHRRPHPLPHQFCGPEVRPDTAYRSTRPG